MVDAFLSGKAVGDSDAPSPAVIRATAEMIYDRFEPIIKADSKPANDVPSFFQINVEAINTFNIENPETENIVIDDSQGNRLR